MGLRAGRPRTSRQTPCRPIQLRDAPRVPRWPIEDVIVERVHGGRELGTHREERGEPDGEAVPHARGEVAVLGVPVPRGSRADVSPYTCHTPGAESGDALTMRGGTWSLAASTRVRYRGRSTQRPPRVPSQARGRGAVRVARGALRRGRGRSRRIRVGSRVLRRPPGASVGQSVSQFQSVSQRGQSVSAVSQSVVDGPYHGGWAHEVAPTTR